MKRLKKPIFQSRHDSFHKEDVDGCLENCYTWRQNSEPVCLSDECSALLPHIKKVLLIFIFQTNLVIYSTRCGFTIHNRSLLLFFEKFSVG